MTTLTRLFTDHPASVDESYGQHLAFALRFAALLFAAALAALIHAILPFLFEKTASRITLKLADRIRSRGLETPHAPGVRSHTRHPLDQPPRHQPRQVIPGPELDRRA